MRKTIFLLFVLQSCIGAGDIFARKKKITGNYYLVEGDDGRYSLSYKIDGVYIGCNPSNSWVIAYAIKDSVLIIKTQDYESNIEFYVVNMNKDNGYSKDEEIYMDTIPEGSFKHSWIGENRLKFTSVK
jgi:hypothetical protein